MGAALERLIYKKITPFRNNFLTVPHQFFSCSSSIKNVKRRVLSVVFTADLDCNCSLLSSSTTQFGSFPLDKASVLSS